MYDFVQLPAKYGRTRFLPRFLARFLERKLGKELSAKLRFASLLVGDSHGEVICKHTKEEILWQADRQRILDSINGRQRIK